MDSLRTSGRKASRNLALDFVCPTTFNKESPYMHPRGWTPIFHIQIFNPRCNDVHGLCHRPKKPRLPKKANPTSSFVTLVDEWETEARHLTNIARISSQLWCCCRPFWMHANDDEHLGFKGKQRTSSMAWRMWKISTSKSLSVAAKDACSCC